MTLRTPQIGDRASAAEDRLIVGQLQDQQTRDFRQPIIGRPSEVTLFGEITEVLTGGGVPRYAWKLIYCDPFPIDPTYADSLMLGDNEDMPYLFEANRGATDDPSYSVGDRVLIHVILTANGACFVVDSLPVGEKLDDAIAEQTGIVRIADKQWNITGNATVWFTPGEDWRGRAIRWSISVCEDTEANADDAAEDNLLPWYLHSFGIMMLGIDSGGSNYFANAAAIGGGHVTISIATAWHADHPSELFLLTENFAGDDVVQVRFVAQGFKQYDAATNEDVP